MLADILHFIEFILVFGLCLIVLFIVLLIVISMMPKNNPLKMMLLALAHRVGATAGLIVLDPVVTGLPVVGEVWDLATIAWIIYFWYTFFKHLPAMQAALKNTARPDSRRPTTRFLQQPTPRWDDLSVKRRPRGKI